MLKALNFLEDLVQLMNLAWLQDHVWLKGLVQLRRFRFGSLEGEESNGVEAGVWELRMFMVFRLVALRSEWSKRKKFMLDCLIV